VPRSPLSDHVDFFWAFDVYGGPYARERVLPTATSELVVGHFIHDFRAFCGINPTAYVRVRGPQRNHIPLAS
jgi:hypothetical protein